MLARCAGSHEGAEARDGLADDQILHLIRAFVGIERFAVCEETRRLVVGDDAVSAEQLASTCAARTIRPCEAVMLGIILASRSCTNWNEPIGLPNCIRSCAYLSAAS